MTALAADQAKPDFEGSVNGFRLYSFQHAAQDRSIERKACAGGQIVEFREIDYLKFTYLPPGTAAWSPVFESVCEDGSIANAGQRFVVGNMTFDVAYVPGELALVHDASADRVSPTTVNGKLGVEIRPVTEDGFGHAWLAFTTGDGFIVVDAREMPLEQVRKIAEGVICEIC